MNVGLVIPSAAALLLVSGVGKRVAQAFWDGFKAPPKSEMIQQDKELRDNLSEKQLDKMLKDSFPASDPVAMY